MSKLLSLCAALIANSISPAHGSSPLPDQWDAGFAELVRQQMRVSSVGFKLATVNNDLCDTHQPQAGWVVQDPTQYKPDMRAAAIRFLKMNVGITVMLVVPDGPAARAGILAGDAITAINGRPVAPLSPTSIQQPASSARIDTFSAAMDAAMIRGSSLVSIERGGRTLDILLTPVIGCASRTDLSLSPGLDSYADGSIATITIEFVRYTKNDDELAVVLGHETAHNVHHDHPGYNAPQGRIETGAVSTRRSETEADITGLYLMAHAGYDYHKAASFWRRFGKDHGLSILASPSHPSWTKRAKLAQVTATEIDAKESQNAPLIPDLAFFGPIRNVKR